MTDVEEKKEVKEPEKKPEQPKAEPKAAASVVTKKAYTPLIEVPQVAITMCAQVLPNRLQCWRAGDYLIKEEVPEGSPERSYQLCSMHATILQRADALAEQEEASGKTTPEDSDPKSIHSRMMAVEQKRAQSSMLSGEKSAQR